MASGRFFFLSFVFSVDSDINLIVIMEPFTPLFWYEIDADNRVLSVCEEWNQLADAFSEFGPRADDLIGTNILDHITGMETRHLFVLLFDRARTLAATVEAPFRCDGPVDRRFMKLLMEPVCPNNLKVTSVMLRHETCPYTPLLDVNVTRSDEFLQICAWCKNIQINSMGRG